MRTKRTTSAIITLLAFSFVLYGCMDTAPQGDLEITDTRVKPQPEVNLSAHKPYDVEIFRVTDFLEGYKVRYYQTENNKLVSHEATHESTLNLDKANYYWMSDTCVAVRLYNDSTQQELKFKVCGYGPRSSISDELK
jgi:hypothetical protein